MGNAAHRDGESHPPKAGAPIPAKLYYKIGEVCEIAGLPPHVLRFWEHEFSQLVPTKSPKGHRLYRKRDIETILKIKDLLYERKFTIKGAREFLGQEGEPVPASAGPAGEILGKLKDGLHRLRDRLGRVPPF